MQKLTCFKAYDIRGELGEELNEQIAYDIGRAFAEYLSAKLISIGADIRLTSESLKQAMIRGITDAGADVLDLGMTGSEEVYFSAFHLPVDGGIEITASHNPINYNGMKFVGRGATPIGSETGLMDIQRLAEQQAFKDPVKKGTVRKISILDDYIDHLLSYIELDKLKPMKIVVNAGNGAAGHIIDALELQFIQRNIPVEFIKIHNNPDGTFPNGIPNPLLVENRSITTEAVIQHQADCGIAWDGDFDRCFLFDETGAFIEGYYIVGLLADAFLNTHPNATIIHDPRLIWNTLDIVEQKGGQSVQSKTGHAFIKAIMRETDAVYGGEMSAHHYFKDFGFCDSGMIPWLLIIELISNTGKPLSKMVDERIAKYPCSGEINYKVDDVKAVLAVIKSHFEPTALAMDETDGISFTFEDWRFNIRGSNTEPLLRLNVESKGDIDRVAESVRQIEALITQNK